MAQGGFHLRLGTRGSALALVQAHMARAALAETEGVAESDIEIVVIKTTGDAILDRALSQAGGKGLFTKELDSALLDGGIDFAVHSAKDLPTKLPDALEISGYLPREDVRDALITAHGPDIGSLPQGATLGSASLRRQAMMLRLRPDLKPVLLRGNVETRLRKAESGEVGVTLLALAGLKRLGLAHRATALLDIADFLPAVGQGAVAVTARRGDAKTGAALARIFHAATGTFLEVLDGSCRTPIAGHAHLSSQGRLEFHGLVLRPDGSETHDVRFIGLPADAARLGRDAGHELLGRIIGHAHQLDAARFRTAKLRQPVLVGDGIDPVEDFDAVAQHELLVTGNEGHLADDGLHAAVHGGDDEHVPPAEARAPQADAFAVERRMLLREGQGHLHVAVLGDGVDVLTRVTVAASAGPLVVKQHAKPARGEGVGDGLEAGDR